MPGQDEQDNATARVPGSAEQDFVSEALETFKQAFDDESDIRQEAAIDLKFVAGEQWDPEVERKRNANNRPALTFNRLGPFVAQVANEARQNKPQIRYAPVEDADKDTAEVREGLIRQIQYQSEASIAYETGLEYSASCGFGYWRVLTRYADLESFDQDIVIDPIVDPFSVYGALMPAIYRKEATDVFIVENYSREEFKRLWPNSRIVASGFDAGEYGRQDWVTADGARVAEYWKLRYKKQKLYLCEIPMPDGTTARVAIPQAQYDEAKHGKPVDDRDVELPSVESCQMTGAEVLPGTKTTWAGKSIPVIPVLGKQMIVEGRPRLLSLVRFMRDPQQLVNYYKTRIAETLGTAPISPFIAAEGQLEGHENEWEESNWKMRAVLTYKPSDVNGNPVGPPQRQAVESPIQALSMGAAQEVDDLKSIAGIFDASLGASARETSGIAIARRDAQSSVTNLHFSDNMERSFQKTGRIIDELIPEIYDTARTIKILGQDEAAKIVKVNQPTQTPAGTKTLDIRKGKYDLVVTVGRGFSSKRMEAFDMIGQMIAKNPALLTTIGDIFFQNSDVAGADQLAERFKKMLPPELQPKADQGDPTQLLAQAQAQLQALSAQHEQLVAQLNQAADELKTKKAEQDARIQIEAMRIEFDREKLLADTQVKMAQLGSQEALAELTHELEILKQQLTIQQSAADRMHEAGMQAADHDAAAEQAAMSATEPEGDEGAQAPQ